ncbi:hypothetical protein DICVIV_07455 [Dictyocaulus viviparus]|uniref:Uncharacterized protein n=1 Tax=Dictyocaulus viviparus TaxID=29172 RepID=A0A0D8XVX2_DICVI|nr:hypothetical protein DICVIV_07455 [Dictyocaulus viviparus]
MFATQRSLLLALSSFSLAALFVWYVQSKKKRGTRRILGNNHTGIVAKDADSTLERQEYNLDTYQSCCVASGKEVRCTTPIMNATLGEDPESTDEPSTPNTNYGIAVESNEDRQEALAKDDLVENVFIEEKELSNVFTEDLRTEEEKECGRNETEMSSELLLDVSHHAEPEAFSWSDEMERSYVEMKKKEEEQQRQHECSVAINGSGDYATSDSPGLASQNSEECYVFNKEFGKCHCPGYR